MQTNHWSSHSTNKEYETQLVIERNDLQLSKLKSNNINQLINLKALNSHACMRIKAGRGGKVLCCFGINFMSSSSVESSLSAAPFVVGEVDVQDSRCRDFEVKQMKHKVNFFPSELV